MRAYTCMRRILGALCPRKFFVRIEFVCALCARKFCASLIQEHMIFDKVFFDKGRLKVYPLSVKKNRSKILFHISLSVLDLRFDESVEDSSNTILSTLKTYKGF